MSTPSLCALARSVTTALMFVMWVFGLTIFAEAPSNALPQYLDAARQTFYMMPGGNIQKAGCQLCHAKPTGGQPMNPYGAALREAMAAQHTLDLTPVVIHSVDSSDSDGDGFANIDEIKADTLPGDSTSHPPRTAKTPASGTTAVGAAEMSPFDVKAALLAKHAQHPVIVHFPIALFVMSFLFDLIGRMRRSVAFHSAAYINLGFAAFTSVFSVITGLVAWQWQFKGEALSANSNLLLHLIFGSVSFVAIGLLWWLRRRQIRRSETMSTPDTFYLALASVVLIVVALAGHLGSFVSGVSG